jgi:nicotinamidase-related amidase
MRLPGDATLIVVADASAAIADGGDGKLRDRQTRIAALQIAWRRAGLPVVHVEHSPGVLRAGADPAMSLDEEPRLTMVGQDVFLSTGLEELLTQRGATTVVLCGAFGDPEMETAVLQACKLGFRTFVVADAADSVGRGLDPAADSDRRDRAIDVDTATALAAAARIGTWRTEKAKH